MQDKIWARHRVAPSRDPRFPVVLETSADDGKTWHPIPIVSLQLQESVDGPPLATVKVRVEGQVG